MTGPIENVSAATGLETPDVAPHPAFAKALAEAASPPPPPATTDPQVSAMLNQLVGQVLSSIVMDDIQQLKQTVEGDDDDS